MPANRLTADCMAAPTFAGAYFEMYIAVRNPAGTPRTIAPAVPYTLVRINGNMPYDGSADVGAHDLPKRKEMSPIFFIAGMPDITR